MITFDGDRSLKRKWFAEKNLAVIHDLDVPSKAIIWEGFTIKAWQQGDIDGGRVTAPIGAVVACSSTSGVQLAVADFWLGGFKAPADLHVLFAPLTAGDFDQVAFFNKTTAEEMTEAGYFTVPFRPAVNMSAFGLVDGVEVGAETVYVTDYSCAPVLLPDKNLESLRLLVTDSMAYDLDGNGAFDWLRTVAVDQYHFYLANGSGLARKGGWSHQIEYDWYYLPWRIYQWTTPTTFVMHHSAYLYDFATLGGSVRKVCNRTVNTATATTTLKSLDDAVPAGFMPAALRTILLTPTNDGSCTPLGSYAFTGDNGPVFLHGVNATTWVWGDPETRSAAYSWYLANPGNDEWRLFYSWTDDLGTTLVNADQFLTLLDDLADLPVIGNWFNAKRMLAQLISAYPNSNFTVPYDSFMFHAHDGAVYTWTRKYGAVKFTRSGMYAATVLVPPQVTAEPGVRPEISYLGIINGEHLYLCVCNKVASAVKAVYIGSPFTPEGWTQLPGAPEGFEVVHVRPISLSRERVRMIGVLKRDEEYRFGRLVSTTAPWETCGVLPFSGGEAVNFSCTLYGVGADVDALAAFPVLPPLVPQTPVGPYSLYAIGMP